MLLLNDIFILKLDIFVLYLVNISLTHEIYYNVLIVQKEPIKSEHKNNIE
jgi:hypothetical protein